VDPVQLLVLLVLIALVQYSGPLLSTPLLLIF
jgi:hypothetical protein